MRKWENTGEIFQIWGNQVNNGKLLFEEVCQGKGTSSLFITDSK